MSIDGKLVHADFITCSGHKSWATGGGTMGILAMQREWEKKVLKPSRHYKLKPLELLGCTTRGTSALTLMASFPMVKERVKIWREEVEKARWFSSQLESLGGVRQLGEKPHCHDLLGFETPVLDRIAQKNKRRGYYLYEELRKRKIVGIKPGRTRSLDLSTYQLTKEQLRHVVDSFKDIVNKLSPKN
jgi:Sep-tRNA:Cys-tRNA synthetase